MKQKPMFELMSDEITDACTAIVERYRPQIKKRKVSPNLVFYWVMEGARRTRGVYKPNDSLTVSPDAKREANTSGGIGSA